MKKLFVFLSVFLLLSLAMGTLVFAATPSISLKNGADTKEFTVEKGGTYDVPYTLINEDEEREITARLEVEGVISSGYSVIPKEWMSFLPSDSVDLESDSNVDFNMAISVPLDAEVGVYKGMMRAILSDYDGKIVENAGLSGVSISTAVGSDFVVNVVESFSDDAVDEGGEDDGDADSFEISEYYLYLGIVFILILVVLYRVSLKKK